MGGLSSSYYQSSQVNPQQVPNEESFKVISTSLENPYDIARKRESQAQFPSSQNEPIGLDHIVNYTPLDLNSKSPDHRVKIVVVGDGGCGKTCLLISYARGEFPQTYVPTIFENYISQVQGVDGKVVELSLWDTAGQEEYDRLRPLSYPDTNVLLVCYAVDNRISLQNVRDKWAPEVKLFCEDVPIILVGTKLDMFSSAGRDSVDYEAAEELAREIDAIKHIRCSAKTTENIRDVFNAALAISQNDLEHPPQFRFGFKKKFKSTKEKNSNDALASGYYENDRRSSSKKETRFGKKRVKKKCIIF
jgi:small GTP-binding protein